MKHLHERLNYMIDHRELTAADLARRSKVDPVTISRWRNRKRGMETANMYTLAKIADALHCDYRWLATGDGEPYKGWTAKVNDYQDECANRREAVSTFLAQHPRALATVELARQLPPSDWPVTAWLALLRRFHERDTLVDESRKLSESGDIPAPGSGETEKDCG